MVSAMLRLAFFAVRISHFLSLKWQITRTAIPKDLVYLSYLYILVACVRIHAVESISM